MKGYKLTYNNTLAITLQNLTTEMKNKVTQTHTHTRMYTSTCIRLNISLRIESISDLTPFLSKSTIPQQIETLNGNNSRFQTP